MIFDEQYKIQQDDFRNHGEKTIFVYKDYSCEIIKSRGHWCGYVSLQGNTDNDDYDRFGHYNVHGGITFIQQVDGKIKIGFDCAHSGDFCDVSDTLNEYYHKEIFRRFDYVQSELKNLVNIIIDEGIYKP